jgi:hypothetical protein
MRTEKEISNDFENVPTDKLVLELLLDMRELLIDISNSA